MKLRDSGMPDETYWESLFDVRLILDQLDIDSALTDVAELGCGYGTFTIPIAERVQGQVYTFDIEPTMVARTEQRARAAALGNIICRQWDVMERGFDVPRKADATLLFNILHCENPTRLLEHAIDATRIGGRIVVIHWRHDSATPRGPSLEIRPRPQQVVELALRRPELAPLGTVIDLPPWHYGLLFERR